MDFLNQVFYLHVFKLMLFQVDLIINEINVVKGLHFRFTEAEGFTGYILLKFSLNFVIRCRSHKNWRPQCCRGKRCVPIQLFHLSFYFIFVYSLNFNIKCPHRGSIYNKIYRTIYLVDIIDAYHLIHVHE